MQSLLWCLVFLRSMKHWCVFYNATPTCVVEQNSARVDVMSWEYVPLHVDEYSLKCTRHDCWYGIPDRLPAVIRSVLTPQARKGRFEDPDIASDRSMKQLHFAPLKTSRLPVTRKLQVFLWGRYFEARQKLRIQCFRHRSWKIRKDPDRFRNDHMHGSQEALGCSRHGDRGSLKVTTLMMTVIFVGAPYFREEKNHVMSSWEWGHW